MTLLNSERKPSSYLNKGRRRVYAAQIWVTQIGLYCPSGHNEIFGQEAGGNLKRQTGPAAPRERSGLSSPINEMMTKREHGGLGPSRAGSKRPIAWTVPQ